MEKCTFIEIHRDVDTITREEISLLIQLLSEEFAAALIVDSRDNDQEEQEVQEELIGHMLEHFRVINQHNKLFAYREDGRVLVFNK
jgi:Zn-dependent oligopeptidase